MTCGVPKGGTGAPGVADSSAGGAFFSALAIANWAKEHARVRLEWQRDKLAALGVLGVRGVGSGPLALVAREIAGFQPAGRWAADGILELGAKGSGFNEGWLLEVHAEGGGSGAVHRDLH